MKTIDLNVRPIHHRLADRDDHDQTVPFGEVGGVDAELAVLRRLPALRVVQLGRLGEEDIARLAVSMLGAAVGGATSRRAR